MNDEIQVEPTSEEELRRRAIERLRKKENLRKSLVAYVLVNAFLVGIWAIDGADDYFWPVWVIGGWGLALAFQAYDAYGHRGTVTEDQVRQEMDRLRG